MKIENCTALVLVGLKRRKKYQEYQDKSNSLGIVRFSLGTATLLFLSFDPGTILGKIVTRQPLIYQWLSSLLNYEFSYNDTQLEF
jgi:hypothetical protein